METGKPLFGAMVALLITASLHAQSDLMYDGVDLTKMKRDDALPLSSAQELFDYREARRQLIPTDSAAFRNMARNPDIPENIEEIYFSYNWLEVSRSFYLAPESFECYGKDLYEADYLITDRKRGDLRLWLRSWHEGIVEPYIDLVSDFTTPHTFVRKGKYFYRYSKDPDDIPQDEYNAIVDYKNGILTLEITFSGKVGDFTSLRRFRKAYMAVPKTLMQSNSNSTVGNSTAGSNPVSVNTANTTSAPIQPLLAFRENQLIDGDAAGNLCDAFQTYKSMVPDAEQVKNMRAGQAIHPGLEDDLYDYDWIEYAYNAQSNGSRLPANQPTMQMLRFHPQAGTYLFSLTPASGNKGAQLRYLNNWNQAVTSVMRQGSFTYLASGNQPVMTVVSYDSNVLIVDEKEAVSGAVYRRVYIAVPPQF